MAINTDLEQVVWELQLETLEPTKATVISPEGRRLVVAPPPSGSNDYGTSEFQPGYLVKDLGIDARQLLGLPGYTQPWRTTRIVHQGEYLPMHQPLIALCPDAAHYSAANLLCTFCKRGLWNKQGIAGAFKACWFCRDSPSLHHGACCPHNPMAREWNGVPHHRLHQANMQNFIRTLPFQGLQRGAD